MAGSPVTQPIALTIGGVDRYNRLISSSLRWTEYEGGQTGAMSWRSKTPTAA